MVLTIAFMFFCAFALLPFIGFALWLAFSGDKMRAEMELAAASRASATQAEPPLTPVTTQPTSMSPERTSSGGTLVPGAA